MDPLTQGLLGAAAAQVVLGKRLGHRGWIAGAIGGLLPDADILIRSTVDRPRDPGVARMKLDWWRNEISGLKRTEPRHPLLRALREGGLVVAERGQAGGYRLSRPPEQISAAQALAVLGGRFYEGQFCEKFTGQEDECAHTLNCSIR